MVASVTISWNNLPLDATAISPLAGLTDFTTPVNPRPITTLSWAEDVPENTANKSPKSVTISALLTTALN